MCPKYNARHIFFVTAVSKCAANASHWFSITIFCASAHFLLYFCQMLFSRVQNEAFSSAWSDKPCSFNIATVAFS